MWEELEELAAQTGVDPYTIFCLAWEESKKFDRLRRPPKNVDPPDVWRDKMLYY